MGTVFTVGAGVGATLEDHDTERAPALSEAYSTDLKPMGGLAVDGFLGAQESLSRSFGLAGRLHLNGSVTGRRPLEKRLDSDAFASSDCESLVLGCPDGADALGSENYGRFGVRPELLGVIGRSSYKPKVQIGVGLQLSPVTARVFASDGATGSADATSTGFQALLDGGVSVAIPVDTHVGTPLGWDLELGVNTTLINLTKRDRIGDYNLQFLAKLVHRFGPSTEIEIETPDEGEIVDDPIVQETVSFDDLGLRPQTLVIYEYFGLRNYYNISGDPGAKSSAEMAVLRNFDEYDQDLEALLMATAEVVIALSQNGQYGHSFLVTELVGRCQRRVLAVEDYATLVRLADKFISMLGATDELSLNALRDEFIDAVLETMKSKELYLASQNLDTEVFARFGDPLANYVISSGVDKDTAKTEFFTEYAVYVAGDDGDGIDTQKAFDLCVQVYSYLVGQRGLSPDDALEQTCFRNIENLIIEDDFDTSLVPPALERLEETVGTDDALYTTLQAVAVPVPETAPAPTSAPTPRRAPATTAGDLWD